MIANHSENLESLGWDYKPRTSDLPSLGWEPLCWHADLSPSPICTPSHDPTKPLWSAFPNHASHWNQNDLPKTDMTRMELLLHTTSLAPQSLPGRVLKMAHRAIPNLAPDHPFSIFFSHSRPAPHTEHLHFPTRQARPYHSAQALLVSPYLEGPPNTPHLLYLLSQASNPLPRPALLFLSQPPASSEDVPRSLRQSLEFCRPCSRVSHRQLLKPDQAELLREPVLLTSSLRLRGPWKQCHAHCCTLRAEFESKISCQILLVVQ